MKFVSFRAGGKARYGLVSGNGVVDLTTRRKEPDLKSLIAANGLAVAASAYWPAKRQISRWMRCSSSR